MVASPSSATHSASHAAFDIVGRLTSLKIRLDQLLSVALVLEAQGLTQPTSNATASAMSYVRW
jgi:hypothetical protein